MWRIVVVIAAMALCAASATPYQESGLRGGYHETQLAPDTYSVQVDVNGYTSRGTALTYAYRRAGELCPTGFDIVDRESSTDTSYVANGNRVSQVDKPEVTMIVRCRPVVECVGGPGCGR